MADPYYLQSLELSGFRAYLQPKTFDFKKKQCLAIFAPNKSGKSSVIDALEFMLSKDGTLERLGQRAINNQAGPIALAHNLAEQAKIASTVTIGIVSGTETAKGSRDASSAKRAIPPVAATLNACLKVSPIIRGHALRAFVENHTPEQRYADVAKWLELGPFVEVQKNVRALKTQLRAAAEDETPLRRLDSQLARDTGRAAETWEEAAVLHYANASVLAPLDPALSLVALTITDAAYVQLMDRAKAEENKVGLTLLRGLRNAAIALWAETTDAESSKTIDSGHIPAFIAASARLSSAVVREAGECGKASSAVFHALWKAAEPFFAQGASTPPACPVCATPLRETTAGSAEAIRNHISEHLRELSSYADAKGELDKAKVAATTAHTQLKAALPGLIGLLSDDNATLRALLIAYQNEVAAWQQDEAPSSADVIIALRQFTDSLNRTIAEIEEKQGESTYIKAKGKIDRLLELQAERELALRKKNELANLFNALTVQAETISNKIREKVQMLLDGLQTPMNDIYKLVQGADAQPIRLELPPEDDINQQRLNLLIDFASNRTGVQPGGYLSDSQIHSLALAFRLAAIKEFNKAAPIIALDDIVTSYDADHRRSTAGLIASEFDNFQILLTTHDERFFNYLKDQLEPKVWHFTRIIGIDPAYGPRFADHKVSDEMVEARWAEGKSAANEIRQAEEEWLLGICRDFGVSARIRPLEKPYSYERSELALALAGFLKDCKLEPALVPGVNNKFLTSLTKGEVENFGSHFQDGPHGYGSIGDEQKRWEEFKAFRNQFVCKKCNRTKFQRPFPLNKPVCAHSGCEAQFEFTGELH